MHVTVWSVQIQGQNFDTLLEQKQVLNVQSPHEFNCHRLNRDTWRDQIVSDLIQQNFVFYQVRNRGQCLLLYL